MLKAPRLSSPEPMLASWNWLPVLYRIQCKFAIISLKAITTWQTTYHADLLHSRFAVRHTRSLTPYSLVVSFIRTKMASRAGIHAAPTFWNNLSHDLRETTSINSLRTRLKTLYFKVSIFNDKSDVSVPLAPWMYCT